jgi:cytochrome c-type biogenesis protein CcmH
MQKMLILVIFIMTLLAAVVPVLAQQPDYDRINEIAKELNCPTCTGINLADCRTLTCEQWRAKIGDLVAEGYTNEQVVEYFSTRYGTQVLQEPPRSGFTLALWLLPVLALLAGGGWLWMTMRGWSAAAVEVEDSPAPAAPPANNFMSQVDKDLGLE